jgi:hypothetical protein
VLAKGSAGLLGEQVRKSNTLFGWGIEMVKANGNGVNAYPMGEPDRYKANISADISS